MPPHWLLQRIIDLEDWLEVKFKKVEKRLEANPPFKVIGDKIENWLKESGNALTALAVLMLIIFMVFAMIL